MRLSDRYCEEHECDWEFLSSRWRCRACHNRYQVEYRQRKDKITQYNDARKYGLTASESKKLRARIACDICGTNRYARKLHIDHDHETGKIRGTLCHGCNISLGMLREDPEIMRKMIEYIEEHK